MILHTINKTPSQGHCLSSCLRIATETDAILLIEDGTYCILDNLMSETSVTQIYALKDDIQARGLTSKVPDNIVLISFERFVELSEQANAIQSWY